MNKVFDPANKENIELIKSIYGPGDDNPHDEELRIMRILIGKNGKVVSDATLSTIFAATGERVSLYIATVKDLVERGVIVELKGGGVTFYNIHLEFYRALNLYKKYHCI